jgi:hypothetical protein
MLIFNSKYACEVNGVNVTDINFNFSQIWMRYQKINKPLYVKICYLIPPQQ